MLLITTILIVFNRSWYLFNKDLFRW